MVDDAYKNSWVGFEKKYLSNENLLEQPEMELYADELW